MVGASTCVNSWVYELAESRPVKIEMVVFSGTTFYAAHISNCWHAVPVRRI